MVNVAAFYAARRTGSGDRRGSTTVAASTRATPAAYVNFLGDEGRSGSALPTRTAPGTGCEPIKRRYDPANLFHRNQNIPPAEVTVPGARRA